MNLCGYRIETLGAALPKRKATKPPLTRRILRTVIRRIATIVTSAVALLALIQSVLPPSVQTPSALDPNSPLSLPFEIKNENVIPLFHFEYECELVTFRVKNNPNVKMDHVRASEFEKPRTLWGRQSTTGRCDKAIAAIGFPIEKAEYQLRLRYFPAPIPFPFHEVYDFTAIMDENGNLYRWVPK
jgi:hypothetical protein